MSRLVMRVCGLAGILSQLGCTDAAAPSLAGTTFTLTSVNEAALPYVYQTTDTWGTHFENRLVGRAFTLFEGDSVQYIEKQDLVQVLPDGSRSPIGGLACFSMRGSYTIHGNQLALTIKGQPEILNEPTVRYDTLVVNRDSLMQAQHEQQMIFHIGASEESVCPVVNPG